MNQVWYLKLTGYQWPNDSEKVRNKKIWLYAQVKEKHSLPMNLCGLQKNVKHPSEK